MLNIPEVWCQACISFHLWNLSIGMLGIVIESDWRKAYDQEPSLLHQVCLGYKIKICVKPYKGATFTVVFFTVPDYLRADTTLIFFL